MKKINTILTLMLLILTICGVWGIHLLTKETLNVNLSLTPSSPILSVGSGFYDEAFPLTITAEKGTDIFYTVDGSTPTSDSIPYTEPIMLPVTRGPENNSIIVPNISSDWLNSEYESYPITATILRAVAIDKNGTASDCVTATYFFNKPEGHLIISIVTDPENLFGNNGIYVTGKEYDDWYLGNREGPAPEANYNKHGKDWERPADIEFFWDYKSVFQQPVGIRIQGASARWGPNKRFSVYSRKEYSGSSWFNANIFGDKRCHAIMLRSGFMNGYIQHLVQDRDIASAESSETWVYINGALWYVTIVQEKFTEKYFQEYYNVKDDNVVIAKGGIVESGKTEDQLLYQEMYDYLYSHDMSMDESYEQLNQLMDIQSYIDFCCTNVYFANMDFCEYMNVLCWRTREKEVGEYGDARWRWGLYDMDLDNLNYGIPMTEINTFTLDTHYAGGAFNTRPMYVELKKNGLFRKQFVLSFMDMVNTDFTLERATEAMESWVITMPLWGMKPEWMEDFFPARTQIITGYLADEFGLTGTQEQVVLSVNDSSFGHIVLNTITPELENGSWSGSYFTDYPVTVTAVADKGHRFIRWESENGNLAHPDLQTMTVEIPDGGLKLTAIFE